MGFSIRVRLKENNPEGGGSEKSSANGWAKPERTVATPVTMERCRKLAEKGIEASVIAEVMDLDDVIVEELLQSPVLGQTTSPKRRNHEQTWVNKVQENRTQREITCNPQFEEDIRLLMPARASVVVVELVGIVSKAKKVVADFEVELGQSNLVEGPFDFMRPGTKQRYGDGQLIGTLQMWRLG